MVCKDFIWIFLLRAGLMNGMIVALGFIVVACTSTHTASGSYQSVRFRTIGKIPVIDVFVNGKPACFIVDTGASVSILDLAGADYYGFVVAHPLVSKHVELNGFGGRSQLLDASQATLRIGQLSMKYIPWKCQDMRQLLASLHAIENTRIAGVIGSDVFAKYRMTINYGTHSLTFRIPEGQLQAESLQLATEEMP